MVLGRFAVAVWGVVELSSFREVLLSIEVERTRDILSGFLNRKLDKQTNIEYAETNLSFVLFPYTDNPFALDNNYLDADLHVRLDPGGATPHHISLCLSYDNLKALLYYLQWVTLERPLEDTEIQKLIAANILKPDPFSD